MTTPEPSPAADPAPEKTIEMPPTLAILAVILLVAAIMAQVLSPGRFQMHQISYREAGVNWTTHVVVEGETLEAIIEKAGGRAALVGEPVLAGPEASDQPVTSVSAGQTVRLPMAVMKVRDVVVPGTYATVERAQSETGARLYSALGGLCMAPIEGFKKKADIIAFILIIGASFGIVFATGAIDAALHATVERIGHTSFAWMAIPATMMLFSFCGAMFGMSEEVIPFVMITIPLAFKLGYDSYVGICMSFVAAGLGFATGFYNPFTVQLAQGIAQIPPTSGLEYRVVLWVVVTLIGIAYVMPYALRVKRDPTASPAFESDKLLRQRFASPSSAAPRFDTRAAMVLFVFFGLVAYSVWGVTRYHWYLEEIAGCFFAAGVLSAIVSGMSVGRSVTAFLRGASELVPAAIVVALSAGVVYILEDNKVMHTILHAIATPLEGTHAVVGAWLMFLFQSLMNLLVNSGSGQASVTMPLMAPLADLMGVSRQTAVLAYQFGNGFADMILPTSAVTMSVLGIARIPWERWIVWALPLQAILIVFGCVALAIAVVTGYS